MTRWLRRLFPRIGPIGRGRTIGTAGLCGGHLMLAVVYLVPSLSKSPTPIPGRVSIVDFIDSNGPWIVLAFGLTGLAMLAGLLVNRGLSWAHGAAAGVSGGYTTASLLSAFLSEPNRPIVAATLAAIVTAAHFALADSYVSLGER